MEFRNMRRKGQLLPEDEAIRILENGKTCILALIGDGGYPYSVPVNYVYEDGKITFHGAKAGHKADAIRQCDKVSACVIASDDVIGEKLTTAYSSVIVFGRARILEDPEEIFEATMKIGLRYNDDYEFVSKEARSDIDRVLCVEIQIEHMTGKEGMELHKLRKNQ